MHGDEAHVTTSLVSHVGPVQPSAHMHMYEDVPSTQTPPFLHGDTAQSSTLLAHVSPVQPAAQAHVKPFAPPAEHVPPCKHGESAQLVGATEDSQVAPKKPLAQLHT